jgi:hypothetical protein
VTALWTVTVLLAVVVVATSVAVIALARQVGILHERLGAPAVVHQPPGGIEPGRRLRLDLATLPGGPPDGLVLLGFVRPGCGACGPALTAFATVAAGLPAGERVVLVSDAGEGAARAFLAAHGADLPLLTGPHLLSANAIPATPFAVVADPSGTVLAARTAGRAAELAGLLGEARRSRQAALRNVRTAAAEPPGGIVPPEPAGGTAPPPGESSREESYVL